jgi:predicted phage gp36 major capsid-like protein
MKDVQEIFNRIKEKQQEQKVLKGVQRDVLANSQEYQLVLEEVKAIKEKKKQIESNLKSELRSELDKLDEIKSYIASDREMLSNLALTQLIKGETVGVVDEHNNKYQPVFSVRFEKI